MSKGLTSDYFWYYHRRTWFGAVDEGPISEERLADLIESGAITAGTILYSPTRTNGQRVMAIDIPLVRQLMELRRKDKATPRRRSSNHSVRFVTLASVMLAMVSAAWALINYLPGNAENDRTVTDDERDSKGSVFKFANAELRQGVDPIAKFGDDPLADKTRYGELTAKSANNEGIQFAGIAWVDPMPGPIVDPSLTTLKLTSPEFSQYRLIWSLASDSSSSEMRAWAYVERIADGNWSRFGPAKRWFHDGTVEEEFTFSEDPIHLARNRWDSQGNKLEAKVIGGQYSAEVLAFNRPVNDPTNNPELKEQLSRIVQRIDQNTSDRQRAVALWPAALIQTKRLKLIPIDPYVEMWLDLANTPTDWSTCGALQRRTSSSVDVRTNLEFRLGELEWFPVREEFQASRHWIEWPDIAAGNSELLEWQFVDQSDDSHWRMIVRFRLR